MMFTTLEGTVVKIFVSSSRGVTVKMSCALVPTFLFKLNDFFVDGQQLKKMTNLSTHLACLKLQLSQNVGRKMLTNVLINK